MDKIVLWANLVVTVSLALMWKKEGLPNLFTKIILGILSLFTFYVIFK